MKRSIYQDGGAAEKKACVECCSSDQLFVRPSQVPVYLRESEFYRSLDKTDDAEFGVPANYMKDNMNVETLHDACHLLETFRYWGFEGSLSPVVMWAISQPLDTIETELSRFVGEFPVLKELFYVVDNTNVDEERMEAAMRSGRIDLVRHVEKKLSAFTMKALAAAAAQGHYGCLEYALQKRVTENIWHVQSVYEATIANGHINCLQLIERSKLSISEYRKRGGYVPACYKLASVAAKHGQLKCLQFLHFVGYRLHGAIEAASAGGHLACLKYAVKYGSQYEKRCASVAAIEQNHVECVRFLHMRGCPLTRNMTHVAAIHGSLQCLKYLHDNGCEWDVYTCHTAAMRGHLDCLQYAYEYGSLLVFVPSPSTSFEEERNKFYRCFHIKPGPYNLMELVAQRKHWDCVTYLFQQNYPLNRALTAYCAKSHQYDLLKLAGERGCPMAVEVGVHFAKVGSLEGLAFAFNHGCCQSTQILCAAARNGHLECMKYAYEQGCVWSAEVCEAAARGGHLECLEYARENGCPWDGRLLHEAGKAGREDILEYAKANGCVVRQSSGR